MSLKTITNQTLALAGISLSCYLVDRLATNGSANNADIKTSINSILKLDSANVLDIFGNLDNIRPGLKQLQKQITSHSMANLNQGRYAVTLVFLVKLLNKKPDLLDKINLSVQKAQAQAEIYGVIHENVLSRLGDLYYNTVGTLHPRIMVNGNETYLTQPAIVNKIRALLLAGIRATILWRQCGGSRWRFLIYRKKLQNEIKFLLKE